MSPRTRERRPGWPRAAFFPGFLSARGGGAARSACLHAASLAARGLSVAVDGLYESTPTISADLALASCDVRVHPATTAGPLVRSPQLLRHLRARIGSFDLVHLNGAYDMLNYRIARLCEQAGVPYIVSARSLLDPAAINLLPDGVPERFAPLQARYVRSAYAVHFTSDFEASRACFDGAQPRRVITIPNAVQLDRLVRMPSKDEARRRLGVPRGQAALLYYGRLVAQKQPEFALRVLSALDPAIAAHVYFVGSAAPETVARLVERARDLGVADRIHFAGHAAGRSRDDWLAAADALLLTSAAENFSLALVEAVAAGLPAVVSPHIGALEFLRPGDAEIVPMVPDAWAAACERLMASPAARDGDAFTRLWNQFRPDGILAHWRKVYQDLPDVPKAAEPVESRRITDWAIATWAGASESTEVGTLPGGASSRTFYRLKTADSSVIAFTSPTRQGDYVSTYYDSTQPADWVRIGPLLRDAGLPVPEVLAYEPDRDWLLVEDFGERRLDRVLAQASPLQRRRWHVRVFEMIAQLQSATPRLGSGELPMTRALDSATLTWELFHFVEWALEGRERPVADADRVIMLAEFSRIAGELAGSGRVLTHRDFHAQNLMVRSDDGLGLLDFDDLLLGNPVYDLVSFVLDAHTPADYDFVDELVGLFSDVYARSGPLELTLSELRRLFDLQAVQRSLKASGRFVWLAQLAGKPEYLDSLPNLLEHARFYLGRSPGLKQLRECLARYEPLLGE